MKRWCSYAPARRQMQVENITTVFRLLQVSSLVGVIALLVCAWRAEGTGYWLLGAASFLLRRSAVC